MPIYNMCIYVAVQIRSISTENLTSDKKLFFPAMNRFSKQANNIENMRQAQ